MDIKDFLHSPETIIANGISRTGFPLKPSQIEIQRDSENNILGIIVTNPLLAYSEKLRSAFREAVGRVLVKAYVGLFDSFNAVVCDDYVRFDRPIESLPAMTRKVTLNVAPAALFQFRPLDEEADLSYYLSLMEPNDIYQTFVSSLMDQAVSLNVARLNASLDVLVR